MPDDEKTMKDAIEETYDSIDEKIKEEEVVEEVVEEEIEEKETAEVDETQKAAAEEAAKEVDESGEAEKTAGEEDGAKKLEPLAHWLKEDKESFEGLDPGAQEFLIRRDKDFQRVANAKMQETAELSRSLDPLRQELSMSGISDAQAVRTLVGAHLSLKDKPKESIQYLMRQYGLSAEELFSEESTPTNTVESQRIAELENKATMMERTYEAEHQAGINANLEAFRGQAEFFDDVMGEMIELTYAARAQFPDQTPDLQAIYKKACWSNDAVREKLTARQAADDGTTAATERSMRASKAKVHSTPVAKKTEEKKPKSLTDALGDNWDAQEKLETTGTAL